MTIVIKRTIVPHPTINATTPKSLKYLVPPVNFNDNNDFTPAEPEQSRGRTEIFTVKARECQKVEDSSHESQGAIVKKAVATCTKTGLQPQPCQLPPRQIEE